MGLQGTLSHLNQFDIYDFLQLGNDGITIGVLLGLAASKVGSMDTNVSKTLRLHLPVTLPSSNLVNEVPSIVQVRA